MLPKLDEVMPPDPDFMSTDLGMHCSSKVTSYLSVKLLPQPDNGFSETTETLCLQ